MTSIIRVESKKKLKEMIKSNRAADIYVEDPSLFAGSNSGYLVEVLQKAGRSGITASNRPTITGVGKREWYAAIKVNTKGKIVVS